MNLGEIILYVILGIILSAILFKMLIYNKYLKPKALAKKQLRQIEEDYDDNLKELEGNVQSKEKLILLKTEEAEKIKNENKK